MDKNIYYVNPRGSMDQLSHLEVELLTKKAKSQLFIPFIVIVHWRS